MLYVVIPVYNESECIEKVISEWTAFLENYSEVSDFRICLINDGSTDNTLEILEQLKVNNSKLIVTTQENQGHGVALLTGYKQAIEASPDWIFQTDSDDQFVPEDFPQLWETRLENPYQTGHRKNRHDPWHRIVINRMMRSILFLVFGAYLKDPNVPYRLIKTDLLKRMLEALPDNPFAPNVFLSLLAKKWGYKLGEYPVQHKERETGVMSLPRKRLIKACLRSTKELICFRISLGK